MTERAEVSAAGPTPLARLLAGGIAAGAVVVALSGLGPRLQMVLTLALGLGGPVLLLLLTRPVAVVVGYLFLLPLFTPAPLAFGLNGGELLTFVVLVLASTTVWTRPAQLRESARRLQWILWPVAALCLVSAVSMLVNSITTFSELVTELFKIVTFGAIPLLVHVHAAREPGRTLLLKGLLLGGAGVAVYSVVAYLAGWSWSEAYQYNRAMGTFGTWNHLGAFMALVSMPTLGYALRGSASPGRRAALIGFFGLEMAALLLSLTTASLLGLIAAAAIFAPVLFRSSRRRVGTAAAVFAVAVGLVVLTNPLLRDKLLHITPRILDRFKTYEVGFQMFRDHVWFGFGSFERLVQAFELGSTRYRLTSLGQSSVIPHNSLILIGVEKGIMGVVTFAALMVGSVVLLLRHRRPLLRSPDLATFYQGAVVGAGAFLLQNLSNNLLLHARLGVLFLALVALVDAYGRGAEAGEREAG